MSNTEAFEGFLHEVSLMRLVFQMTIHRVIDVNKHPNAKSLHKY